MADFEATILAELERLAPAADGLARDWRQVRSRVGHRDARLHSQLRPILIAIVAGLVLAGVATATYLALRSSATRVGSAVNGPVVVDSESHGEVTLLRAVGGDGHLRTIWKCPHGTFCGAVASAVWSPDGKRLALAVFAVGLDTPYFGLDVADVRTGKLTNLTSERRGCGSGFGMPNGVDWSSDGRRIAFTCDLSKIGVISSHGSLQRSLATGVQHVSSPSWSPDGTRLVFAAGPADHSSIYIIDADGRHRRLLARHGRAPSWSPTGDLIAYRGPSQGAACGGLRLVTAEGRDATPPTPAGRCHQIGPAGSEAPEWSPDGTELAVATGQGIYVMQADGTNLRQISRAQAYSGRPAWQPLHGRPAVQYEHRTTCSLC